MPVEEGFVTVNIDGQDVKLLFDTNAWGIKLAEGGWYESEFGEGACGDPWAGCYFCSKKSPCSFENGEVTISNFGDGSRIESIERNGSLVLGPGDPVSITFKIFKAIKWVGGRPHGFFGLLAGNPPPSDGRWLKKEGLLDALVRRRVIGRQSYTFLTGAKQVSGLVTGQLTLGDTIPKSKASKWAFPVFTHDPKYHRIMTSVWVSSVKLFDPRGNLTTKEGPVGLRLSSFLATMDTGANDIYLPYPGLLEDIEERLKREMKERGYGEQQIAGVWRKSKWGRAYVKKEAFESLPVLGLRLDDGYDSISIKIHPKHYCAGPFQGEYIIFVKQTNDSVLGTPFFRAYSVHVDYTNNKIALLEN
ncbi:hypothetical protein FOZ60_003394 [Perkinsus olseni]|uniref:Peptidase A1 domain-containing protein n=2 Tax=Perkinsus olseni TaxID=32597 RepID=A0A7J6TDU8_PEROL|nr:hypothetical protein FOZ60_003394 [Perkinsus olseni]KAF4742922.1 hypothetical protein FOZ62_025052 [Perkinsus olseni]